jgi:peptidyl-prolyl cis-trans isomerase SurA
MRFLTVSMLAGALLLAGASLRAQQGASVIIQKIIVKVNGEIFTQTDLVRRQIEALKEKSPEATYSPADLQNDAKLKAALAEVTPVILVDAVDELLWVQHARELGITMREDWYKKTLADIQAQNKLSPEQFERALKEQIGMTMAEYREMMEMEYLKRGVQEREIAPRMTITEEEMRQYYAAHPELFGTAETITLREIFIAVPSETKGGETVVNVAAAEAAQKKIEAARDRVMKGEDFAKVAAEVSEAATKDNGGSIGQINVSDLNPQIASALSKLKAGEMSPPIRIATGYLLYKVDARSESGVKPFDEVRNEVQQRLFNERVERESLKFIEKLRAIALIEWKDELLKKLYDDELTKRLAAAGSASK